MVRRLVVNPLIVKDALSRVRTWRAPAIIAVYLGLLGLFAWLAFSEQLTGFQGAGGFARVGGNVFSALALAQLALVCLFTPGVAAGAISGERERQTLDVLLVSCVPSFGIVWGKLVASVAFILLLILAALPLFATVFLFGGIDAQQFVVAHLVTVTTALAIASLSLFLSALLRRTLAATVVAYGLTFAATAGTWLVGTILALAATTQGQVDRAGLVLAANPVNALLTLLRGAGGSPLRGFAPSVATGPGPLVFVPSAPQTVGGPGIEPWQVTVAVQLGVLVLCVLGTVALLRERRGLVRG